MFQRVEYVSDVDSAFVKKSSPKTKRKEDKKNLPFFGLAASSPEKSN
jgi:hypothetical protein